MTTAAMRRPGKAKAWRGDGAVTLWDAHRDGPTIATRNRLVEWYYPLVRYHARRVGKKLWGDVGADDLIGPGTVGLMQAIETFDETRGVKFETWAYPRITGEMREELRNVDWRGRRVRGRINRVKAGREELGQALGHVPTDEELGEYLGIGDDEFCRTIADATLKIRSMDRKVGSIANGGCQVEIYHFMPDARAEPVDAGMLREEVWDIASRCLSAKQREVIQGCYFEDLTLAQIGLRIGLCEQRVSQIRAASIQLIRERFADRLSAYIA